MTRFKTLLFCIITSFILVGCDLEENSGNADVTSIETERSLNEEKLVIETSVIPNENGSELKIELPNNFRSAMSDKGEFESVIVTRDDNNAVNKWSLTVDEDSSQITESISFDTSSLNSITFHFYNSETGSPVADCISISEITATNFSCELRTLEEIKGTYEHSDNDQYIDITVENNELLSLEGAIVSSECYGPLGILDQDLGGANSKLSTFIPNYLYGVLEIYKDGQYVFFKRDYYSGGMRFSSVTFPSAENSEPLRPNNAYTAQSLKYYGPEQSLQIIAIPEFQSARKSAHNINSYAGITASAQTEVTISSSGVNYLEGVFHLNLNGEVIKFIDLETLAKGVNESAELSLNAYINQAGDVMIIDDKGDDITIELCSSYIGNSLVISAGPYAGPVLLGGTPSSDRFVTVGGVMTWQEEDGYELEVPINSFLELQAGTPNTQLPNR